MEKTIFVVLNENTFGYALERTDKLFFRMVVMAVDVPKGGDPTLLDRTTLASRDKSRQARKQDFERFKICVPGFACSVE